MSLFEKKGIRSTGFRKDVLAVFVQNENAVTVQQIEEALGDHDRITLYRTIKTFVEQGLIHEIVMTGGIKKYALCKDCDADHSHHGHHHHEHVHFHCEICDEVICVETDIPKIVLPGFQVDSLEIQGHGICPDCAAKNLK